MGELARLTTREVLIAARVLIPTPRQWAKGDTASKAYTGETDRLCVVQAISKTLGLNFNDFAVEKTDAYRRLQTVVGEPVGDWNDERTHAEVLAAFDKAIAECDA